MSHIRFGDSSVVATSVDEEYRLFEDLERSRRALRATIAEAACDPTRHVGRFVLVQRVERNAAGELHQAWDDEAQRFVAVRTVDGVGALTRDAQRALETATLLRHPGILAPLPGGFGVAPDGRLFVAMEIAPGRTLEPRRGESARREPRQAATIVLDLARALGYAQGLGLVHGALHPASVIVNSHGQARLIDWGVAEAEAGSPTRRSHLQARLERRGCAAPELTEGEAGDPLTDVYGLGALLLLLAGGKTPAQLTPEAEDPDPCLPPTLEPVVRRCLEADPIRRYPSPVILARDLERWLNGERPAATTPLGVRLGRLTRRVHRAFVEVCASTRIAATAAASQRT